VTIAAHALTASFRFAAIMALAAIIAQSASPDRQPNVHGA